MSDYVYGTVPPQRLKEGGRVVLRNARYSFSSVLGSDRAAVTATLEAVNPNAPGPHYSGGTVVATWTAAGTPAPTGELPYTSGGGPIDFYLSCSSADGVAICDGITTHKDT